jgi:hypothetical protein
MKDEVQEELWEVFDDETLKGRKETIQGKVTTEVKEEVMAEIQEEMMTEIRQKFSLSKLLEVKYESVEELKDAPLKELKKEEEEEEEEEAQDGPARKRRKW